MFTQKLKCSKTSDNLSISLSYFFVLWGHFFHSLKDLLLFGLLLSRLAHSLVVILGPPSFWVSVVSPVYWILMTSSFFIQCPFLPKYIYHENFLGKGAWAVKILRLYSSENIFILDWLVVWSLLKIIFPYNFKCHAPLSYSIHYSCENSDTVFLHGVCFYTLEAFSSFFSPLAPPTLHDDVWVFIHSCWWVLDLVESVNL